MNLHTNDTTPAILPEQILALAEEAIPEKITQAAIDMSPPAMHPVLNHDALYGLIGEITKAATADSEADPAAVIATALTWVGAHIGTNIYVPVGETRHPARLFCAIVGASSRARKGTSTDPVRRIFNRAEQLGTVKQLKFSPGPLSSGEGVVWAVRDASEELDEETQKPKDGGVTDKRLIVIEGELGAALSSLRRQGNTLSAILRTAWDHGNIEPLTKNNRIRTTNAHICVVGHITKQELLTLLEKSDIYNGFANRFLWVAARRQKSVAIPLPMHDNVVDRIASKLADAIACADRSDSMTMNEEASEFWCELYPKLTLGKSGIVGIVTDRGEGQVVRLALIYALLDKAVKIRKEHVQAAYAFWRYCEDSASFIFGCVPTDDPERRKILSFLGDGEKTQTALHQHFSGHLKADKLRTLLAELQASGAVTQRQDQKSTGKPSAYWRLTNGFSLPANEK